MRSSAVRFCIALNGAALLRFLAFELVPDDLDVRTDIVGYPTYANFNVNRYFWAYGFTVVLFPLLTFGIFLALTRCSRFGEAAWPIPPPLERVETTPPVVGWRKLAVASGRALLVGFVLGLEVVIASDVLGNKALFVLTTLGYCGTVALVGWGASRLKQRNPFEFASSLNTAVVH